MKSHTVDRLSTEHAVLGFLVGGPRHGYAIYQELSDPDGLWLVWRIKQSQLYALLVRLEAHGYLTSTLVPQGGRPPRKLYQITASGREAYLSWIQTPVEHGRQFRLDLLIKLFFARREGQVLVDALFKAQRDTCRQWLDELQATITEAGGDRPFRRFVYQYRAGQVQAMLNWLETCQAEYTTSFTMS